MAKPKRNDSDEVIAKTTIVYEAPLHNSLPVPDFNEEIDFEDSIIESIEPNETDTTEPEDYDSYSPADFVNQLKATGVVPESGWSLKVEKFPPESLDSGPKAFKLPCNRFVFTPAELQAKKHVDRIKTYGPGRYWLTLRAPNSGSIAAQWELLIDDDNQETVVSPITSQAATVLPGVVQSAQAAPFAPVDPFAEIEKSLRLIERLEKLRGNNNPAPAPATAPTGKGALLEFLLDQPQAAKQITANLFGQQNDSTMALLLQNLEPIGNMLTGVVNAVLANLQPQQVGNPLPNVPQVLPSFRQSNHFRQTSNQQIDTPGELAKLLLPALTGDEANLKQFEPANTAAQIIQLSDYADANNSEPISHFVEMLARYGHEETMPMLSMLLKQPLNLGDYHKTWLDNLKLELRAYYEPDEFAEPAKPASAS